MASIILKKTDGNQQALMRETTKLWAELVPVIADSDIEVTIKKVTGKYSKSQRGALHLWCDQCAKTLNDAGIYRQRKAVFGNQNIEMFWTLESFKEDVYNCVLNATTGLESTEDQTSINPSDVALVISKQYAENGLTCPAWPSLR